jgi:hypothetical protein
VHSHRSSVLYSTTSERLYLHPLYSFAISVFSHAHTAATAFISLSTSLIGENPLEWRAEAILPPIITILAAYLALASLYRTASWAIRLSFSSSSGDSDRCRNGNRGYLAGQGTDAAANQPNGGVANFFSSMFGGGTSSKHKRQMNHRRKERPKPWHSFKESKEWQYQQQPEVPNTTPSAQQLMDSIVHAAEGALGGKWWSAAIRNGFAASTKETESRGKNGKSRSR